MSESLSPEAGIEPGSPAPESDALPTEPLQQEDEHDDSAEDGEEDEDEGEDDTVVALAPAHRGV